MGPEEAHPKGSPRKSQAYHHLPAPEKWTITDGLHPAIVDRELFDRKLYRAGSGARGPHEAAGGTAFRRPAAGADPADGDPLTPKLLLLDEHTAALDPGTADKVLELTKKIVAENHLTCLMITHNMHDALTLGNRTLMMDHGHIVLDISGEERAHTTVDGLLDRFAENVGHALDNDRILLSKEK